MKQVKEREVPVFLWILISLAAVFIALAIFLFAINCWSMDISLNGGSAMTVEYGESFQDPGAEARFHGSLFFQDGWEVTPTANGQVNSTALGAYTVTYTAKKLFWSGEVTRTVTVRDTTPPEITLTSNPDSYTLPGSPYEEEGFQATDLCDGDLTQSVQREEKDGVVYYSVADSSGNRAEVTRTIHYHDPVPPELTLSGTAEVTLTAGTPFQDPGCTASDNCDGDLTSQVQVSGTVNTSQAGTYELVYTVTDSSGNTAQTTRTVTVTPSSTATGKVIYLTFDDGPGPYTQKLLDVLDKYNVKVTFFTTSNKYSDLIAAEAAAGHSVAIHTASHEYSKIYSSEEAYFADLEAQKDLIYEKTGQETTLLRFPGGSSNTVSAKYCQGIMTRLTQAVTAKGYQYFDWNVSSGDAGETTDTETVYQNVIAGVQKHNVSIVLQHDIKEFSVDAVEKIIQWGLANGYTFLPLDSTSPTSHHSVNN